MPCPGRQSGLSATPRQTVAAMAEVSEMKSQASWQDRGNADGRPHGAALPRSGQAARSARKWPRLGRKKLGGTLPKAPKFDKIGRFACFPVSADGKRLVTGAKRRSAIFCTHQGATGGRDLN